MVTPLNLRLPVAPPSPLYLGLNEDINTEPFPDYTDSPGFEAESGHCTVDCSHIVCISLALHNSPPNCHCAEDDTKKNPSPLSRGQILPGSTLEVNDATVETAREAHEETDCDHALTIHCQDAQSLVSQLELYLLSETKHIEELAYQLYHWLSDDGADEAIAVSDFFFITMRMYVLRTLYPGAPRVLTLEELCAEIHVYLWTMLREYVDSYAALHPELEVENIGPDSFFEVDPRTVPGMVARFWQGCAHEFVALLVLQSRLDEEEFGDEEADEEAVVDEVEEEDVEQEAEMASRVGTDMQIDETW